ncbi:DmsC/YnfH family molybdoenzyme membrane anchor subunit [Pseudorhodobacter sp.]|uniref:dimethyl sulfoxide reductase anchor subunit family protein n=1 Tax=Pseudorhodobacter sp. TaxID=1934400 RepID=UPI002647467F|nr:DmsC/YnfH family molybdoenzyme membrane anchor subunit [Pseudorhodobacter sp.]MDN5786276.1 dimethyl sulfoxide reductase anchor subunit [Pseudorhodobacter sp.]
MHPAPSVIIFSVLSGLGFGFMAYLALGFLPLVGTWAFIAWAIGYALAVGGLVASTAHLGNPQRALKAFTQWRSSWLSREGWAAVLALFALAPVALGDWMGFGIPFVWRGLAAAMALVTVVCTAMIYTQIKAVPRWHHWLTPVMFMAFSVAGGALLAMQATLAFVLLLALAVVMMALFFIGDREFARAGASMETATGLGRIGEVAVFEQPHTGDNYLLREMIFVVGRKHAQKLRVIAVLFAAVLPALMAAVGGVALMLAAVLVHLTGAFVARWLFFAQAEHVVGLYYGKR